jgi:phosphinothricin acetyltransferase
MQADFIPLQDQDFKIIKEIYNYYIINSTATFHTARISIPQLKKSILINHPKYRSFLIRFMGEPCGFCYISRYKPRQAYDRTAEITIYLKPGFTGKGIGRQAIEKMEAAAAKNGIHVFIGVITAENEQSIRLFEKCGYEKCAHYKKVGEKFNRILDVVAMQKILHQP